MYSRVVAIENYWASVVGKTDEFKQIAVAENPEFNKLTECLQKCLQDSFINDATEYGVSRWESMLGIVPSPSDTLKERKVRVMTYLNIRLPYTWRVLKQMLTSFVGENNFTMKYINDISKLIIRIKVDTEGTYYTVSDLLNNVVPQNVYIDLGYLE